MSFSEVGMTNIPETVAPAFAIERGESERMRREMPPRIH
jgi:hypothetical protein